MMLCRKPNTNIGANYTATAISWHDRITEVREIDPKIHDISNTRPSYPAVRVIFEEFGRDVLENRQRLSDFHVEIHWSDILEAIKQFAEYGDPTAKFLQTGLNALNVANSKENTK